MKQTCPLALGAAAFLCLVQLAAGQGDALAPAVTPPWAAAAIAPLPEPPALPVSTALDQEPGDDLPPPTDPPPPRPISHVSIEIDVAKQRAYLLRDSKKIAESPVSTGRPGHLTPTGDFEVLQKDPDHSSSLYGSIVSDSGRIVKRGADFATPVPKGCHFERAPMKYFLRFEGASGMHVGVLPGYPASHGCVRMPLSKAQEFYAAAEIGSPVHVFGTIPERGPETIIKRVAAAAQAVIQPAQPAAAKPAHPWFSFFRQ